MEPCVEILFDCLPLRLISRLDSPLDASPEFQRRHRTLAEALERHGAERTYYLFNARCVFRLANSEVEGMIRYEFDGIVRTDAGDVLTESVDLQISLVSETCGGVPPEVDTWLRRRVERAVAVDFDRFIQSGLLADRAQTLGQLDQLSDLANLFGMGL